MNQTNKSSRLVTEDENNDDQEDEYQMPTAAAAELNDENSRKSDADGANSTEESKTMLISRHIEFLTKNSLVSIFNRSMAPLP